MAGHTKGPWKALRSCYIRVGEVGDHRWVANADSPYVSYDTAKANARLISAAPDMLEALAEARITLSMLRTQVSIEIGSGVDRWEGVPPKIAEQLATIDVAIAKARGEA
ncbi:MAG: hypothetical protein WC718_01260 [Phycisphaerales bacterium]|jgi:hypothetical protein